MARPILLKRPSPFAFPGGDPSFNTAHELARDCLFSGAPGVGGVFVNLLNGKAGTKNGTPTTTLGVNGAPQTNYLGATDNTVFTFPNTAFGAATMVGIFSMAGSPGGGSGGYVFNTSAAGVLGIGYGIGGGPLGFTSNGTPDTLNVAMPQNVPFFFAVSVTSGIVVAVARNLITGALTTFTRSSASAITGGDGNLYIGNRGTNSRQIAGGVSAAMFSQRFTTLQELMKFSEDPWSFWYPAKIDMWAMLRGVSSGGAVINKTVTATCTSTASLTRTIGKTLASTCTSTSTLIRRVSKTLAATLTSTSSLVAIKAKLLTLTATCTSTASLVTHSTFARSLLATCTSTSVMIKNVGKTLAATCTSTSALIRRIGKTLTVTCTSTASSFVHKCVTFTQALNAVCTTTSAVNVLKGLAGSVASLASKLRPYEPQNTPVIPGSEALYLANELQKVRNAFAAHIQATKDLDARLKAAGF